MRENKSFKLFRYMWLDCELDGENGVGQTANGILSLSSEGRVKLPSAVVLCMFVVFWGGGVSILKSVLGILKSLSSDTQQQNKMQVPTILKET